MYVHHDAGDIVGKYKIINGIGRGADSAVYSAYVVAENGAKDNLAPQIVAVKTFTDDNKYAYKSELRFVKNTAIYIDDFSSKSAHYIVIKYLQMDLQKFRACLYISEIPATIKSYLVKSIIKKIFTRIAEIHACKYIHGDISLKNIMIDTAAHDLAILENVDNSNSESVARAKQFIDNINLYLIDFGCSSAVSDLKKLKQIGTPGYVAPEVIFYQDYGCSIDVFSATIAAAELILGDYLFDVFYLYGYSAPDSMNKAYMDKIEEMQDNECDEESEEFYSDIETEETTTPTIKPKLDSASMQEIYTYYKNARREVAEANADLLKKIFLTDGIFDCEIDYDMSINSDYHKIYMQLYIMEKFYISIMDYNIYHGFEGYYYNMHRKLKFHTTCDKYTLDDLFDIMGYGHKDIIARTNLKKFISLGVHAQPSMRPTAAAMAVYIDKLLV